MLKEMLADLLESETYDAANSYAAFHQPGADYVCLLRTPRLTVKLYHFDPKRYKPVGDAWGRPVAVNPHTHRYAFQTVVLQGELTNVLYRANASSEMRRHDMFMFETGLGGDGKPKMSGPVDVFLSTWKWQTLRPGDSYDCRPHEIHSVIPHAWLPTTLALFQHADVADHSSLFATSEVSFDGLYQPLSEERAKDIIAQAKRATGNL